MEEFVLTALLTLLVWGINIVSISNHRPDGLSQTVSVRFLSALVQ